MIWNKKPLLKGYTIKDTYLATTLEYFDFKIKDIFWENGICYYVFNETEEELKDFLLQYSREELKCEPCKLLKISGKILKMRYVFKK